MKICKAFIIFCLLPQLVLGEEPNWYDGFLFQERSFTFEFIRTLGYTASGAADIGEAIGTARAIHDKETWKKEWSKTAERMAHLAEEYERQGDLESLKEVAFRASNYFRTAGFYLCEERDRQESNRLWQKSVESFKKGAKHIDALSEVKIPYEGTTLPAYLIKASAKNAPLIIIHTGFDGTKEELYFEAGLAAVNRGYNVLLFEGPGQGEVIRRQKLPFRPDWEKVVTPVVDFAQTLDFIDKEKIALYGISLGGYLAARAAAFEHRLACCIVNGGIYDFSENIYNSMPPEVIKLIDDNPEVFNQIINEEMTKSVDAYWFYNNAMWTMQAKTPAEVMQKLKEYSLNGVIQNIKCPMLVIDSEADIFLKGQPQKVYDALKCQKTLLSFSAKTQGQAHCQVGAVMTSNESIFTWLKDIL